MRLVSVLASTVVLAVGGCVGTPSPPANVIVSATPAPATATPTPATPAPAGVCHGLAHVYNPGRLHVLASCVSVRGVIVSARQEPDGDLHVLLRVDANQRDPRGGRFTNSVNDAAQRGDLVLEPVCVGPVIQPDAQSACAGYHNPLTIPPPGTHVVVTGPWVLDAPHGWNEVHPLERVEVLP
jgi:hypothetical protein